MHREIVFGNRVQGVIGCRHNNRASGKSLADHDREVRLVYFYNCLAKLRRLRLVQALGQMSQEAFSQIRPLGPERTPATQMEPAT